MLEKHNLAVFGIP